MASLFEISPKTPQRVIDLVSAAGVDVSVWGDYAGGEARAASNPKYCYQWSFTGPNELVVLNLWFDDMKEVKGVISIALNMRETACEFETVPHKAVRVLRARAMDEAIQSAYQDQCPVRVVVCEGEMKSASDPKGASSRVNKRLLDPVSWAVTAYDVETGACTLTRGAIPDPFVDQFEMDDNLTHPVEQKTISGKVFVRNPAVRRRVLIRAQGKCEFCSSPGFVTSDGRIFLETHHVIALSENGADSCGNVVALCPNHHREAHHGQNGPVMRDALLGHTEGRGHEVL